MGQSSGVLGKMPISPALQHSIAPICRSSAMTLFIRPIMNSSVEEIFAFKTCCGMRVFDQNLEIQITNQNDYPVYVQSYFDLVDRLGSHRIETLMPHGTWRIASGETIAFYCTMDESRWAKAEKIIFHDMEGKEYPLRLV
jgi:hypothetical protein